MRRALWVCAVLAGCESKPADTGEGVVEDDPGPPIFELPDGVDVVPDPTVDWSEVVPELTGSEVCYPGPSGGAPVCIPLVAWSAEWGGDYAYPEPLSGDPQYSAPVRFVDLYDTTTADPGVAIADNFVLGEVMQSYKGRFGLFQVHVVESLQVMRDAIGGPLTVNSAFRNVSYNASVGGATWSRHLYGDAVDIASSVADLDTLADLCFDLGAGYVDIYVSHVHCDWRDTDLDPAFYDVGVAGPEGPRRVRVVYERDGELIGEDDHLDAVFGEGTPPGGATGAWVSVGAGPERYVALGAGGVRGTTH